MSKECIKSFYSCFAARDVAGMLENYHEDVVFSDPAFGKLNADRARGMWQMLCGNLRDSYFELDFNAVQSDGQSGSAFWEAKYDFSQTGRRVHNRIHATFQFLDGKIVEHRDVFDLHRWAKQALGWKGAVLGWTPFFQKQLQQKSNQLLDRYLTERQ